MRDAGFVRLCVLAAAVCPAVFAPALASAKMVAVVVCEEDGAAVKAGRTIFSCSSGIVLDGSV